MSDTSLSNKRVTMFVILSGIAGVLVVALIIKTLPSLMDRLMSGMMERMMARMKEQGGPPPEMREMCKQMMESFREAKREAA